jgi:hypothetical protein
MAPAEAAEAAAPPGVQQGAKSMYNTFAAQPGSKRGKQSRAARAKVPSGSLLTLAAAPGVAAAAGMPAAPAAAAAAAAAPQAKNNRKAKKKTKRELREEATVADEAARADAEATKPDTWRLAKHVDFAKGQVAAAVRALPAKIGVKGACSACGKSTRWWNLLESTYVCTSCNKRNDLITHKAAKRKFAVSPGDLAGIPSVPVLLDLAFDEEGRGIVSKVFVESRVRVNAIKKYGSVEGLDAEIRKRNAKVAADHKTALEGLRKEWDGAGNEPTRKMPNLYGDTATTRKWSATADTGPNVVLVDFSRRRTTLISGDDVPPPVSVPRAVKAAAAAQKVKADAAAAASAAADAAPCGAAQRRHSAQKGEEEEEEEDEEEDEEEEVVRRKGGRPQTRSDGVKHDYYVGRQKVTVRWMSKEDRGRRNDALLKQKHKAKGGGAAGTPVASET